MRPKQNEIDDAREWFDEEEIVRLSEEYGSITAEKVRVLLAATERPTDEEVADAAARYATGTRFGGTAIDDAMSVLRGDTPMHTTEMFDEKVRAFAAGARMRGQVKP